MNERRQARLDHLLNELAVLRQEGVGYIRLSEKRAKISAIQEEMEDIRSDISPDMNQFANMSQTIRQIEDGVRLLRRS
jgi:hypothetical protein